jgi:hypothetical protein
MNGETTSAFPQRAPELLGQTVVCIGGSAGIGLETARRARAERADVVLTGPTRNGSSRPRPRSTRTAPRHSTPPSPPRYTTSSRTCLNRSTTCWSLRAGPATWPRRRPQRHGQDASRRLPDPHGWWHRRSAHRPSPGHRVGRHRDVAALHCGTGPGTRADTRQPHRRRVRRHTAVGVPARRSTRQPPRRIEDDTPIGRVVGPGDVARLAVHLMVNTALTGATYDIDGGQQFV